MSKYGIFISHSHKDWLLAGRVYDYLDARNLHPFLDVQSLRHGKFEDALYRAIAETPYFLCILTQNVLDSIKNPDSWILKELNAALKKDSSEIIVIAEDGVVLPDDLPDGLNELLTNHLYVVNRNTFSHTMKTIVTDDIRRSRLEEIIDLRDQIHMLRNTYIASRDTLEHGPASLQNRFGKELVSCVREGREFTGENHIKLIHMSCYAASIFLTPEIHRVDERAFDLGLMFNLFSELLKDEQFNLEVVINAPDCAAAKDAIAYKKLGNSAMEDQPEGIFLHSYANLNRLIEEDPVFRKAKDQKRFRFMVTEQMLPYALFQVEYKQGYQENDHIKVDLYSENLGSSMDRRSMLVFRQSDPENYTFFANRYKSIRNSKLPQSRIDKKHDKWMKHLKQLEEGEY